MGAYGTGPYGAGPYGIGASVAVPSAPTYVIPVLFPTAPISLYQVRVYDTTGTLVLILDDWNSLYFYNRVSDYGYHTLSIGGDDDRYTEFVVDGLVEVLRRNEGAGVPWYREYLAFHRTGVHQMTDNGRQIFSSYGRGVEDLLHRRVVLWKAGVFTSPSGMAADNAMKEFVRYNAGSQATTGNGRIASGVTTGLTVAANLGAAPTWNGDRAYKNLLDVLHEINEAKLVDFDVTWTGGQNFLFSTYYPRKGTDRTGAGSAAPVVFSLEHANMSQAYLTESRMEEVTAVYVLGQGEDTDRTVVERTNTSELAISPWNRIEFAHDARNQSTTAALNDIGDGHLLEHGLDKHLSFQVVPSLGSVYGRDYFVGDLVLAKFRGVEEQRKITGVEITVSQGKENIRIHFGGE